MSTARTFRQSFFVVLALALAWTPATLLVLPDPALRLAPVVVSAQDQPQPESPKDGEGPAERGA